MLSVLCPVGFIATDRGTLARSRFRTALRRRSWKRRPGMDASLLARRLPGAPERVDPAPTSMEDEWDNSRLGAFTAARQLLPSLEDDAECGSDRRSAALPIVAR